MNKFNVIIYNFNRKKFESYDIMPYLRDTYKASKKHLRKFEDFKDFVNKELMYQFWARCQYELVLTSWPCKDSEEKWDIYDQTKMNIDLITNLLMEDVR